MKINKKLLMAALAGAIVVGGGVGSFAEGAADPNIPKTPEAKDQGMYVQEEYKPTAEEQLNAAKEAAKAKLAANGITSKLFLDKVDSAKSIDSVNSLVETLIEEHYKSNPDAKRPTEKPVEPEEEENVSDTWFNPAEHPFAYRTKEEAEEAAKKALENELLNPGHINNGYEVVQKSDGNWDYVLKIVDKSEEQKPEEKPGKNPGITIDEWNLKNAKEEAIKELKAAGITSDLLLNQIRNAKTIEGVNA
ncbi:MAG: albumin-binding GA domain-containing protein, partial [Finegoldia magna]|nr:albumin-binding GA domain-containing protein [Finegoldia magna]